MVASDIPASSTGPSREKHGLPQQAIVAAEMAALGFSSLPQQANRRLTRRGFDFTLMVVGETGLGKSTLINALFDSEVVNCKTAAADLPDLYERMSRTVTVEMSSVELEDRGVRLRLTVLDTPGFGEALDMTGSHRPLVSYLEDQFERYFRDESALNRRSINDTRVHCCFYLLSPFGHGLKPLDVEVMRQLYKRVNVVPVIGKSDSLTPKELLRLKKRVASELDKYEIRVYTPPLCEADPDPEFSQLVRSLHQAFPFAVSAATDVVQTSDGREVRGREYPWGVVEVDDPNTSDFLKLKTLLVTHMQDLKDATHDLYETYRCSRMADASTAVVAT